MKTNTQIIPPPQPIRRPRDLQRPALPPRPANPAPHRPRTDFLTLAFYPGMSAPGPRAAA